MSELRVGDRLLALSNDGHLIYDDVYAFGHKANGTSAPYVELVLSEPRHQQVQVLYLSPGHFIPTAAGPHHTWARAVMKRAQDVRVGDWVWATNGTETSTVYLAPVESVSLKSKRGLYNPLTLSGTIVVDGFVASAHSDWLLDAITPASLARYLPAMYQSLLSPARLLYRLAGPSKARAFDEQSMISDGKFGTHHFLTTMVAAFRFWLTPGETAGAWEEAL